MKPEYDMSIHTNPDAQAWAKFFCERYKVWSKDGVEADAEGLMIGWFANAMMAMHDHLVLKGAPINGDHAAFLLAAAMTEPEQESAQPEQSADCWCTTCRPITLNDMRFVVCPDCGNKRCPKAHNHAMTCTNSNDIGQPYE